MAEHDVAPVGERHGLHNWEYANADALLAATGFIPSDVGKWAKQLDNGVFWELVDDSPTTWELRTGIGEKIRTLAASGAMVDTDAIIFLNTASGSVTMDLIAAASRITSGYARKIKVKNIGSAGNSGFVNPGAETIDGSTTDYELVDGDSRTFVPRTTGAWESF